MSENKTPEFATFDDALLSDDATFAAAMGLPAPTGAEVKAAPEDVWSDPAVEKVIAEVKAEKAKPRSEDGRFKKEQSSDTEEVQDGEQDASEDAVEASEGDDQAAEGSEEGSEDSEAQEGDKDAEAKEARNLATKFAVVDGDKTTEPGELADTVIEYKADGKVYRETLDKVVRLAQSGRYNEKLHAELDELRALPAKVDELEAKRNDDLTFFRNEVQKLLTDDDYLLSRRTDMARKFTPEAEADRLRRELAAEKQRSELTTLHTKMEQFVTSSVEPRLQTLLKENPLVSEDELMGRFNRVVLPMQRNGIVPPHLWPRVEALLDGEIGSWATHLQESRSAERATAEAKSKAEVRKAQVKAQKAKQVIARSVKTPAGSAKPDAPRSKPIVTADDAVDDIISGLARSLVS